MLSQEGFEQGAKKYRNKSIGSSQFGISIDVTLIGARPTEAFVGLIFCQLLAGYCSPSVKAEADPHVFFQEGKKSVYKHENRITTKELSQTWEWCPGG